LIAAVVGFLACTFIASLVMHLELMHRWLQRLYLLLFLLIGTIAAYGLLNGVRQRDDLAPLR
jgi:cytochrome d ubiquinol oxidase subunit II